MRLEAAVESEQIDKGNKANKRRASPEWKSLLLRIIEEQGGRRIDAGEGEFVRYHQLAD